MDDLFSAVGLKDVRGDMVRNITSIRVSQDLFDDLSDNKSDWDAAIALEMSTKPAKFQSTVPIIHRPFEEAEWDAAIAYPFKNWTETRFSDGSYGVWYGAPDLETTVYETVFHWRSQFLANSGMDYDGMTTERKLYNVRCDAMLLDFRSLVDRVPALIDPADRTLTHQVGRRLHREGHPGLLSRSARCDGDVCAIFNQNVLSNPRELCRLTYRIEGSKVVVERDSGSSMVVVP